VQPTSLPIVEDVIVVEYCMLLQVYHDISSSPERTPQAAVSITDCAPTPCYPVASLACLYSPFALANTLAICTHTHTPAPGKLQVNH